MSRYKITFAYKGTNYCGWQVQPNGTSIQSLIEAALSQILQEPIKVKASGRTDAGVHAIAQVAHFDTVSELTPEKILKALRLMLPDDIFVNAINEVDASFDAQTSALKKTYLYFINHSDLRSPFLHDYYWQLGGELDFVLMQQCLKLICGTHNFKGFCAAGTDVKTFDRTIYAASIIDCDAYAPIITLTKNMFAFKFTGSGFLKHMVRNLVGTIINVGQGQLTMQDFAEILQTQDRRDAGITAPAKGLFLLSVDYDSPLKNSSIAN